MEVSSLTLLAVFSKPDFSDILLDQFTNITNKEGFTMNKVTDLLYTLTIPSAKKIEDLSENCIEAFRDLQGVSVGVPNKSISLNCDNINQQQLEKKIKIPIQNIQVLNKNLTNLNFETVEEKLQALKALLSQKKLQQDLNFDTLIQPNHELSTQNSIQSNPSSLESSPSQKEENLNTKRKSPSDIDSDQQQNTSNFQIQPKDLIIQEDIIIQDQSQVNDVDESIQEPQIQKKRKIEQGLEYFKQGCDYVNTVAYLTSRLVKGFLI